MWRWDLLVTTRTGSTNLKRNSKKTTPKTLSRKIYLNKRYYFEDFCKHFLVWDKVLNWKQIVLNKGLLG